MRSYRCTATGSCTRRANTPHCANCSPTVSRKHDAEIKQGLGGDADAMQTWFDDHSEAKEELYMAVDEERDILPRVFAVFNDLRKNFADPLADYWQLAIATAVVWDDEGAINNLEGLAQHAKATVPSGRLNAIENFKYLIDAEPVMQGRVQYSPWEFLTHVVNNKTPRDEREWALQTYLPPRAMIGRCYHDVPYDYVMLQTKHAQTRLNGQLYTLPNLAQFGGVCAYQADYASRVAKSLGTPAESVEGTALDGEGHAWVMWVELSHMTPEHISFTLQSHGRYRSHRYYVGTLRDPHTGQDVTDRQMELRLHAVGNDVQGKRHADLTMRAYATVAAQEELSVKDRFEFLAATLNLCPGNETAWRTVRAIGQRKRRQEGIREVRDGCYRSDVRRLRGVPRFHVGSIRRAGELRSRHPQSHGPPRAAADDVRKSKPPRPGQQGLPQTGRLSRGRPAKDRSDYWFGPCDQGLPR